MNPIHLGVNVDHVATLRQVRAAVYPDPVHAALIAEQSGADSITVHLREDRRHIQDRDVRVMRETLKTRLNLEMACTDAMLSIAEQVKPHDCCLVPENRAELTTEGGLDVLANFDHIKHACQRLAAVGVRVSIFIDADPRQLDAALKTGAPVVELHTGAYANAQGATLANELERLQQGAAHAAALGLIVNAGHGLHYHNVQAIASMPQILELNIGHAIVARALLDGMANAVREMKRLMVEARSAT